MASSYSPYTFKESFINLPDATAPVPIAAIAAAAAFKPATNTLPAISPAVFKPFTSFSTFSRLSFFTSSCESFSSRSKLFNSALALFNWVCQESVLLSFSPKDSAALARAFSSVDTFSFCASISLFNTAFLAVIALIDLSFLSNSDVTNFISEPNTLKLWLISRRDFLNSRSPSTPILSPKLSAILPPPIHNK